MTLFSIITVTKDNPDGLERTRSSLKMQTCNDYEWIVQDGRTNPDTGIYDAMNKGLDRASGDYVMFMNAGDVFASSNILAAITALAGADFIYGDAVENGQLKPARHNIARGMITHHQAMIYRRKAVPDLRYDTSYHIAADYKYTVQFLAQAQNWQYIASPLCIFETGGISQVKTGLGRREQALIRQELGISAPGVEVAQIAAQTLKDWVPSLYWGLRKRRNTNRA
ncbi:MAG TPA: hypothetical protein VIN59_07360 [Alphaproteobacteria bacterium]